LERREKEEISGFQFLSVSFLFRIVTRDIGGSDPERMAAPRVVDYVKETFKGVKSVKIEVMDEQDELDREFPLLGAVNRAASGQSKMSS
jgi:leucyl aminopeptidase